MNRLLAFPLAAFVLITLNACAPLDIAARDQSTEARISQRLQDYDSDTFRLLNVEVHEGRVLLTGIVPKTEDRFHAVKETWGTKGVVEVINEILVAEEIGPTDTTHDNGITTSVRSNVTSDEDIAAVNYSFESANGTLYVLGIAQSEAERDRVLAHARTNELVRRVVDHTILKNSDERQKILRRLAAIDWTTDSEGAEADAAEGATGATGGAAGDAAGAAAGAAGDAGDAAGDAAGAAAGAAGDAGDAAGDAAGAAAGAAGDAGDGGAGDGGGGGGDAGE